MLTFGKVNAIIIEHLRVTRKNPINTKCVGPWKLNNEKIKEPVILWGYSKKLQWDAHNKASQITDTLVFGMSD